MKKYVIPNIAVLRKRMDVMAGLDIYTTTQDVGDQLGNDADFDEDEPVVVNRSVWDN